MSAALMPAGPVSMATLVETERAANERLDRACKATDEVELGREPTQAETEEWDAANDAQVVALERVMSTVPASPDDFRAQIDLAEARILKMWSLIGSDLVILLLRAALTYVGVIEDLLASETRARLAAEARSRRQEAVCATLQRARDDAAVRAGRAEQAVRDMALDQDRLRRRAHDAEAKIASMGGRT